MDVRFLIFVITLLFLSPQGDAEFGYNKIMPKTPEELEALGLKCVPGRTVMKVHEPEILKNDNETEEDNGDVESDSRRTHMNWQTNEETCKICVCSVEGKDEYCSKRPAKNVNECIRMSVLTERLKSSMPYEHERSLAFRIRRDYIWHRDEIPYSPSAKCFRGNSYYSNNPKANDTTIAQMMKLGSQLDYESDSCFFCICSTSGESVACIYRHPWNCEYYRIIRRPNAARDRYRILFGQDRPAYFRQLSYRLRRTMDDGLIGLLDYGMKFTDPVCVFCFFLVVVTTFLAPKCGGDALCCTHPNGHRRNLHEGVRNKIRLLRQKVPKENILSGSPTGDYVDFVVNND